MRDLIIFVFVSFIFTGCTQFNKNEIVYSIGEKDLIPEGITYSQKTNCFYISSILKCKIVEINAETGEYKDFIPSNKYNRRFVGMIVDNKRNHLWACGNMKKDSLIYSSIFKFNVETHRLIREYHFPDTAQQLVNDLVIDNDGNVFFTDSNRKHIYKISAQTDSIELFLESNEIEMPNGITISPDNNYLYVASFKKGIRTIDINTCEILNEVDENISSIGIDGLKRYKNSLIGIQNYYRNIHDIKIVRYFLDESQTQITHSEIIDCDNSYFDIPTTHVIIDDELFCLATSSLTNVNWAKYEIEDVKKLKDVLILKYTL